jgi:predicted DNA-binding WGR domain protein
MKFQVSTVAFSDDEANIDKFYRTYVGDNGLELRQNGRIGTTGAVAGFFQRGSRSGAAREADKQITAKRRKGYSGLTVAEFEYPDDKLPTDRQDRRARLMFQAFQASNQPGARPAALLGGAAKPAPVVTTVTQDSLEALLEEVMQGINAAILDREEGTRVYAILRGKIDGAAEKVDMVKSYYETLEDLVMA